MASPWSNILEKYGKEYSFPPFFLLLIQYVLLDTSGGRPCVHQTNPFCFPPDTQFPGFLGNRMGVEGVPHLQPGP